MQFPILDQLKKQYPKRKEFFEQLETFYHKKLWHQLTNSILGFIFDSQIKGKLSIQFYTEFVKKFSRNIDQINHLKIIKECLANVEKTQAIKFLENFEQKQAFTDETKNITAGLRANYYIHDNLDKCSEMYHKIEAFLKQNKEVDAFAYSTFYRFAMNYFYEKKKEKLFYDHSLQYLAYTQAEQIQEQVKIDLLANMGIALLASSQIYNFSEIMEQPMLKLLENSEYRWVYEMIVIFNKGDIVTYEKIIEDAISRNAKLQEKRTELDQKIRLMAFLEAAFNLPKNNRVITFKQLADICYIEADHVEFMAMKAASLDLVKIQINQIKEEVTVTWVKPKVLSSDRIGVMLKKFEQWENGVEGIRKYIVENRKATA